MTKKNERQKSGADTSWRVEALHLWEEGHLGRGNCDGKCEGRRTYLQLERHETTSQEIMHIVCEQAQKREEMA